MKIYNKLFLLFTLNLSISEKSKFFKFNLKELLTINNIIKTIPTVVCSGILVSAIIVGKKKNKKLEVESNKITPNKPEVTSPLAIPKETPTNPNELTTNPSNPPTGSSVNPTKTIANPNKPLTGSSVNPPKKNPINEPRTNPINEPTINPNKPPTKSRVNPPKKNPINESPMDPINKLTTLKTILGTEEEEEEEFFEIADGTFETEKVAPEEKTTKTKTGEDFKDKSLELEIKESISGGEVEILETLLDKREEDLALKKILEFPLFKNKTIKFIPLIGEIVTCESILQENFKLLNKFDNTLTKEIFTFELQQALLNKLKNNEYITKDFSGLLKIDLSDLEKDTNLIETYINNIHKFNNILKKIIEKKDSENKKIQEFLNKTKEFKENQEILKIIHEFLAPIYKKFDEINNEYLKIQDNLLEFIDFQTKNEKEIKNLSEKSGFFKENQKKILNTEIEKNYELLKSFGIEIEKKDFTFEKQKEEICQILCDEEVKKITLDKNYLYQLKNINNLLELTKNLKPIKELIKNKKILENISKKDIEKLETTIKELEKKINQEKSGIIPALIEKIKGLSGNFKTDCKNLEKKINDLNIIINNNYKLLKQFDNSLTEENFTFQIQKNLIKKINEKNPLTFKTKYLKIFNEKNELININELDVNNPGKYEETLNQYNIALTERINEINLEKTEIIKQLTNIKNQINKIELPKNSIEEHIFTKFKDKIECELKYLDEYNLIEFIDNKEQEEETIKKIRIDIKNFENLKDEINKNYELLKFFGIKENRKDFTFEVQKNKIFQMLKKESLSEENYLEKLNKINNLLKATKEKIENYNNTVISIIEYQEEKLNEEKEINKDYIQDLNDNRKKFEKEYKEYLENINSKTLEEIENTLPKIEFKKDLKNYILNYIIEILTNDSEYIIKQNKQNLLDYYNETYNSMKKDINDANELIIQFKSLLESIKWENNLDLEKIKSINNQYLHIIKEYKNFKEKKDSYTEKKNELENKINEKTPKKIKNFNEKIQKLEEKIINIETIKIAEKEIDKIDKEINQLENLENDINSIKIKKIKNKIIKTKIENLKELSEKNKNNENIEIGKEILSIQEEYNHIINEFNEQTEIFKELKETIHTQIKEFKDKLVDKPIINEIYSKKIEELKGEINQLEEKINEYNVETIKEKIQEISKNFNEKHTSLKQKIDNLEIIINNNFDLLQKFDNTLIKENFTFQNQKGVIKKIDKLEPLKETNYKILKTNINIDELNINDIENYKIILEKINIALENRINEINLKKTEVINKLKEIKNQINNFEINNAFIEHNILTEFKKINETTIDKKIQDLNEKDLIYFMKNQEEIQIIIKQITENKKSFPKEKTIEENYELLKFFGMKIQKEDFTFEIQKEKINLVLKEKINLDINYITQLKTINDQLKTKKNENVNLNNILEFSFFKGKSIKLEKNIFTQATSYETILKKNFDLLKQFDNTLTEENFTFQKQQSYTKENLELDISMFNNPLSMSDLDKNPNLIINYITNTHKFNNIAEENIKKIVTKKTNFETILNEITESKNQIKQFKIINEILKEPVYKLHEEINNQYFEYLKTNNDLFRFMNFQKDYNDKINNLLENWKNFKMKSNDLNNKINENYELLRFFGMEINKDDFTFEIQKEEISKILPNEDISIITLENYLENDCLKRLEKINNLLSVKKKIIKNNKIEELKKYIIIVDTIIKNEKTELNQKDKKNKYFINNLDDHQKKFAKRYEEFLENIMDYKTLKEIEKNMPIIKFDQKIILEDQLGKKNIIDNKNFSLNEKINETIEENKEKELKKTLKEISNNLHINILKNVSLLITNELLKSKLNKEITDKKNNKNREIESESQKASVGINKINQIENWKKISFAFDNNHIKESEYFSKDNSKNNIKNTIITIEKTITQIEMEIINNKSELKKVINELTNKLKEELIKLNKKDLTNKFNKYIFKNEKILDILNIYYDENGIEKDEIKPAPEDLIEIINLINKHDYYSHKNFGDIKAGWITKESQIVTNFVIALKAHPEDIKEFIKILEDNLKVMTNLTGSYKEYKTK